MIERRIVQFVVVGARESSQYRERLYVLADDGSMWRMDDSDLANGRGVRRSPKRSSAWLRIPALPGREAGLRGPLPPGAVEIPGYGTVINSGDPR